MEIRINKRQEEKKGGFLSGGPTLRLTLDVSAVLSEEELALTRRYGDPTINQYTLNRHYDGTEEQYKVIKIDREPGGTLSDFRLSAYVDGNGFLGNIQGFESACVRALTREMNRLQNLNDWEGETLLTDAQEDSADLIEMSAEE